MVTNHFLLSIEYKDKTLAFLNHIVNIFHSYISDENATFLLAVYKNKMINSRYKRLGVNTLFMFIGNVGPRLVSFILMPFYTFWLSKEDFGIQDIISVYSVLIIPYVTLGLYEAVFVFPKGKDKKTQSHYFTSSIIITALMLVVCSIVILSLPESVKSIIFPDKLRVYVPILLLMIIIESFQRILQFFTRGIDMMRVFSITGVIYAIIMLTFALVFIPQMGLNGYWIALLSAGFFSSIYAFIAIKAWNYLTLSGFNNLYLKDLLKFSIPLIPNATMWWVVSSINRPILISTVGLDGVGLYAIAGKFPSILSLIFGIFFNAFQISALEEYGKPSYVSFYNNVFRVLLFTQICLTFGFEIFGNLIFAFFIDEKFYDAAQYLPILSLGVVLSNIAAYVGVTFTIIRRTKYFLYSAILAAIVAVTVNLLLIPSLGIMGACVSILLSQFVMALYRWFKSKQYVDFVNKKRLFIMISIFIISLLIYYLINSYMLKQIILVVLFIIFILSNTDIFKSMKSLLCK